MLRGRTFIWTVITNAPAHLKFQHIFSTPTSDLVQPLPQRTLYPLSASPPVYPVPSYPLHSSFPLLSLYASTRWRFAYDPHDPSVRALTWMHRLKTRTLAHARARARTPARKRKRTHARPRPRARAHPHARTITHRPPPAHTRATHKGAPTHTTHEPTHTFDEKLHAHTSARTHVRARARLHHDTHTLSHTHTQMSGMPGWTCNFNKAYQLSNTGNGPTLVRPQRPHRECAS